MEMRVGGSRTGVKLANWSPMKSKVLHDGEAYQPHGNAFNRHQLTLKGSKQRGECEEVSSTVV